MCIVNVQNVLQCQYSYGTIRIINTIHANCKEVIDYEVYKQSR